MTTNRTLATAEQFKAIKEAYPHIVWFKKSTWVEKLESGITLLIEGKNAMYMYPECI